MGIRLFRILVSLFVVPICLSSCGGNPAVSRLEFEESRPLEASVDLEVRNLPGNTSVKCWDKPQLLVTAMIRAMSDERAAEVLISHEIKDGKLSVHVTWPGGGPLQYESCNLRVALPPGGNVKIEGQGGVIKTARLEGNLEIKSKESSIEVLNQEGHVNIDNNGNHVHCSSIQGRLKVKNQDGYIQVIGVQNDVDLETTNQKIELVCFPTFEGRVRCVTTNKGIQVTLGRSQDGEFKLNTQNNKCRWDLGKRGHLAHVSADGSSATIRVGSSANKSLIQTTDAAVKLIVP